MMESGPAPTSNGQPNQDLMKVELEHNIPIRQPSEPASNDATPAVPSKQFIEAGGKGDKHLENLLKDASKSVKGLTDLPAKKSRMSLKKLFTKKPQPKAAEAVAPSVTTPSPAPKTNRRTPLVAVVIAFIAAAALTAVAIYAFRQNQSASTGVSSKSNAVSNQTASGTALESSELNSLATDLQSKIDQLDDAQDFDAGSLSDQNIGL